MIANNKPVEKHERIRAFLIHLGISCGLMLVLLGVIFFVWFPHDFILVGGTEGLIILAGVDLVMGPLLTLIIFNPGKRRMLLTIDLSLIAIAQIGCMAYGLSLVYQQRPLLQVLADDGVHIVAASEIELHKMDLKPLNLPDNRPHNVILKLPPDREAINQLKMVHEMVNGKPIFLSDEIYIPAEKYASDETSARIALIESEMTAEQSSFIAAQKKTADCTWLPLFSIHAKGAAGCYSLKGGVIEIVQP